MIKWYLDKESKIPLYLQLKEQIKYHISTGGLQDNEQLPAVNKLAKELSINFETVRKAYKELEKEGLISMQRAKGTLVTLDKGASPRAARTPVSADADPEIALAGIVAALLVQGLRGPFHAPPVPFGVDVVLDPFVDQDRIPLQ